MSRAPAARLVVVAAATVAAAAPAQTAPAAARSAARSGGLRAAARLTPGQFGAALGSAERVARRREVADIAAPEEDEEERLQVVVQEAEVAAVGVSQKLSDLVIIMIPGQ